VWEPAQLVVSERNQPTPPEIIEEDITPQVESFEPADTWETTKRDEYLVANAQVNKIKAEIGGFEKEISDAGEMKKDAKKRLSKAYRQLNAARASFKSMQADITKDLGEEFDQDEEMN
jgi:predicted  nucleic acid-binding Zn-ribbon protein